MFKKLILIITAALYAVSFSFAGGSRSVDKVLVARRVLSGKYQKSSKDMVVTFIDVGQGNAIFVEAPSGATLLYDCGGTPEWSTSDWDPGLRVVVPFLENKNILEINYAMMSHAHDDHIVGFKAVLYNINCGVFFDPGFAHPTTVYRDLLREIREEKINYDTVKAGDGDKVNLGSPIKCRVFNPPKDYFFQATNSDCNNSSVVLKITYDKVSFLFSGDMESEVEIHCAKKYGSELEANVLQVGHHGSNTASTRVFLQRVCPEVAVIPVGKNNTFGHPHRETLRNLESIGATVYRTDYDGNVIVYTNGEQFIVETKHNQEITE